MPLNYFVLFKRFVLIFFFFCTSAKLWLFTIYLGNQLVHGLGKWYAKFKTGKLRPGIAFTISTNQFHLPKNDREGLKLVTYVFEEMENEFPFGIFRPEKQDNLFRTSVAHGTFLPK